MGMYDYNPMGGLPYRQVQRRLEIWPGHNFSLTWLVADRPVNVETVNCLLYQLPPIIPVTCMIYRVFCFSTGVHSVFQIQKYPNAPNKGGLDT